MVYCGKLINNGIYYHTFYDVNTKLLRFFYDGKEVYNEHLNEIHNTRMYSFKGSGRLLTLIISLGIIASSIGVTAIDRGVDIGSFIPSVVKEAVTEEEFETLSNEEFYNKILESNPSLSEYIEETKDVILKYGQYMDQKEILKTIKDLEIVENSSREEIATGKALAFYTKDENRIYVSKNIEKKSLLKVCIFHELLHYYSQSGLYDYDDFGGGYIGYSLNEGLSEILNAEFNDDKIYTYHKEAAYVGALCELLGPEILARAYFGNSIEALIIELSNYCSRDDAISLIKNIDIAEESFESLLYDGNDGDYENFLEANVYAWDVISDIYQTKYNRNIEDDQLMMAYKSATFVMDFGPLNLDTDEIILADVVVNKEYFVNPVDDTAIVTCYYEDSSGSQISVREIFEKDRYLSNSKTK